MRPRASGRSELRVVTAVVAMSVGPPPRELCRPGAVPLRHAEARGEVSAIIDVVAVGACPQAGVRSTISCSRE
jgi:hypothetical protein